MASLNAKLMLSAVGIALLATPALAQRLHHRLAPRAAYDYRVPPGDPPAVYPNPVEHTGSAAQAQSGAAFDLDWGYWGY
jgi:hypothetical protein